MCTFKDSRPPSRAQRVSRPVQSRYGKYQDESNEVSPSVIPLKSDKIRPDFPRMFYCRIVGGQNQWNTGNCIVSARCESDVSSPDSLWTFLTGLNGICHIYHRTIDHITARRIESSKFETKCETKWRRLITGGLIKDKHGSIYVITWLTVLNQRKINTARLY